MLDRIVRRRGPSKIAFPPKSRALTGKGRILACQGCRRDMLRRCSPASSRLRRRGAAYQLRGLACRAAEEEPVSRKLLVCALVLATSLSATSAFASASDPTDAEVLALAGPKTCQDGGFTDVMPQQLDIPIVTLDPNIMYEYCFRLPRLRKSDIGTKTVNGFVTFSTANLGNTSCGTATTYLIRPDRKPLFGRNYPAPRTSASVNSVQPGGVLVYTPGTWRVLIHYETGCNKYELIVRW
jgi:hypothetical protein